ncbi:MAG TPA: ABC transporter ATP-binding protein/permease [Tissierellia bacterium]|nr:ABC transporter ATP-binding protein/permease [Tissierellia bacterium]
MLRLDHIVKTYTTGEFTQDALKDVSIAFRDNEFVAILGPSGSGKTTLLNLIGGLDRYTSGNLIIDGISTKQYRDRDWDAYRNRAIGFVFQSYNLIPHQSVLANVELALTLAGISRSERRERAKTVLDKVGLIDHIHKRPNQLSGGQMQRVAIARALINDPTILLADEPTGAIDSQTSVQIMDLLKEIARDRLVIMVTHNPVLAEEYATRIVTLHDGEITSDTHPYEVEELTAKPLTKQRVGMSFLTALSLSFTNLKSKLGRTILTAFAGSIGIIGIALILSLSSGAQDYIDRMQADTLSSYPISLAASGIDFEANQGEFPTRGDEPDQPVKTDRIYQAGDAATTLKHRTIHRFQNDLASFKQYLESPDASAITDLTTDIQYGYPLDMSVYTKDSAGDDVLLGETRESTGSPFDEMRLSSGMSPQTWTELIDNPTRLQEQYELLAGSWPTDHSEVMLVVSQDNTIRDITLYEIGLKDPSKLEELREQIDQDITIEAEEPQSFAYSEILGKQYRILQPFDYYIATEDGWSELRDESALSVDLDEAVLVEIVGIIRPVDDAAAAALNGTIAYPKALTDHLIDRLDDAPIVEAQRSKPSENVLTGLAYVDLTELTDDEVIETMSEAEQAQLSLLPDADRSAYLSRYRAERADTYDSVMERLGFVSAEEPSSISLYLSDFDSRQLVLDLIDQYNDEKTVQDRTEEVIGYTDVVGLMTTSITDIIDIISYLLIGFVSISLIVSSIMIGIITYISVLERTKEIGILRSIGASKGDISRVFNAETALIGLASGGLGIVISLLLTVPINRLIERLSGAQNIAFLPPGAAFLLVVISLGLTILAGLIPSRMAATKDPVIALRTE